jgi:hypothetical protein
MRSACFLPHARSVSFAAIVSAVVLSCLGVSIEVTASAGGVRRAASTRCHWQAWVGDSERLLRIARVMDEQVASFREQVSKQGGSNGTNAGTNQERNQAYAVRLEAREEELSLRQIGSPQEVLAEVDVTSLDAVALTVGKTGKLFLLPDRFIGFGDFFMTVDEEEPEGLFAGLSISRSTGATLQVRGNDPDRVRGMFAALRVEIAKGVPWWARLRSSWIWWLYTATGIAIAIFALQNLLASNLFALLGAGLAVGLASGTALTLFTKWILPGFEILSSGRSAKGGRILGIVGSVVLSIVIGVLVNIWTRE